MNDKGPAFPSVFWDQNLEGLTAREHFFGMSLREWYAGMALGVLAKEGIISTSIPSLADATGRDAQWRDELVAATAKSCVDLADAILKELESRK